MERAVVLLSGGMDSTVCLAWAIREFDEVAAIGFDYGQRHRVELEAAERIARRAGVRFELRSVGTMTGSSLTDHTVEVRGDGGHRDLPNTMTPGRNGIFLFHALNAAVPFGARHLVTGICLADDAGFPTAERTSGRAWSGRSASRSRSPSESTHRSCTSTRHRRCNWPRNWARSTC